MAHLMDVACHQLELKLLQNPFNTDLNNWAEDFTYILIWLPYEIKTLQNKTNK